MNLSELRQAITALEHVARTLQDPRRFLQHLEDAKTAAATTRAFAGYTKVANSANNMLQEVADGPIRQAIASIAVHGFQHCVEHSSGRGADFSPSLRSAEARAAALGGLLSPAQALQRLAELLGATGPMVTGESEPSLPRPHGGIEADDAISDADMPGRRALNSFDGASNQYFAEAVPDPLHVRLAQQLAAWASETPTAETAQAIARFESRFRQLLELGERGRAFGEFAVFEADLAAVKASLLSLTIPRDPQVLLERAQVCRNLAPVEFRLANADLYGASRKTWLISAFHNSALSDVWATNVDQFVYDALGYLTVIQAEHRYAPHSEGTLHLLRASHLICRIASSEELVPSVLYERAGRIDVWARYAIGTVLAISGPNRVPPSRVRSDPRFVTPQGEEIPREDFASVLLPQWRQLAEREAACAILLELAGWRLPSAERLVVGALRANRAEQEVWITQLRQVTERTSRVKVLRPNPWGHAGPTRLITCDTNALSVLASDVIHRTFPSLDGSISLNGTSFRARRVPTFLCSADFGPLGLFKVDSRDRVTREASNFVNYAQRLHPRYRASRCDQSVAMISEPDDRIEFVSGLLTSYVFTEREAPRTLNVWFQGADRDTARRVIDELFSTAVKPWYQHATFGVVDILSQYPVFSREGLGRLTAALDARADLVGQNLDRRGLEWILALVDWVTGATTTPTASTESQAAQLQLCESLYAITHGDLHLDNILVIGRPGAENPCLIDFETTGPGHLLRDFGRFAGALLFRTTEWTELESQELRHVLDSARANDFSSFLQSSPPQSDRVHKVLAVIDDVWRSFTRHWRSGSRPGTLEVGATLIASFLPYARYPDTPPVSALLSLSVSGALASSLPS